MSPEIRCLVSLSSRLLHCQNLSNIPVCPALYEGINTCVSLTPTTLDSTRSVVCCKCSVTGSLVTCFVVVTFEVEAFTVEPLISTVTPLFASVAVEVLVLVDATRLERVQNEWVQYKLTIIAFRRFHFDGSSNHNL